jgi:malto-oligosyltrehalose trehalohydrolase
LFRLFAPSVDLVQLELEHAAELLPMFRKPDGWHELATPDAAPGTRYRFVLSDGTRVPDPASRYQPQDVAGPSEIVDPSAFRWTDTEWKGRPWHEAILYELHVGTFTGEGTFLAAVAKLDHLAALGITAIELMCLSDFAGNRNWGYDGVLLFAPDSAYGAPNQVKAFVDRAHQLGISVILDVVYNHFGPEGNYITRYFPQICSERHSTPWGKSLNFDGPFSAEVREFIIQNALYWIEEFHMDGLRLDASHAMIDTSPTHILEELHDRVQSLGVTRPVHLILENEHNIESRLLRDGKGTPLSYTAQWNHDITHLLGAVFTDLSQPQQLEDTGKLVKALAEGFVIAAQMQKNAGCAVPPTAFVAFIQTHDLVGNRIFGDRVFASALKEPVRAIASIYLLLPQIPMLFMGEEWGASTPFPFFCDYHGGLADAVRKGRCEQLARLDPAPTEDELKRAPDPQAEATFRSAQLKWDEVSHLPHSAWLEWYTRMLHLRMQNVVPLLSEVARSCGKGEVVAPGAFAITWHLANQSKLHLAANLSREPRGGFPAERGRVIWSQGVEDPRRFAAWAVRWTIEQASR